MPITECPTVSNFCKAELAMPVHKYAIHITRIAGQYATFFLCVRKIEDVGPHCTYTTLLFYPV